jgi:hypothetical protein
MRTYVRMRPRKNFPWTAIQAHIDAGHGYGACHTVFGVAHATWIKAIAAGFLRVDRSDPRHRNADKRFNWSAIQAHYDTGATVRECLVTFGCSNNAWQKAMIRRAIVTRSAAWTVEEALSRSRCRKTIKTHLLRAGILHNRCDWCGLSSWRGRTISIQIDHVNGIRDDHRLENLRMLCPNCHSQTDTFAAKNIKSNG